MSNQNNESNINAKDFIIGTFVGGIVGAATALLLAPKSGKELRTNINDQAIVLKDKSTELASKAKDSSQSFAKTIQSSSSQVTSKVKDISEKFRRNDDNVEDDLVDELDDVLDEETDYGEHISLNEKVEVKE